MTVDVRPAVPADVSALVSFGSAVVPAHYAPILGPEAAQDQLAWWTPARFEPAIEAGRVLVAEVDGAIVGMIETGELAGEQVVWKLYVDAQLRGRSMGSDLLRRAVADLPPGTDHVLVEHFAGNARAGAFYEREGFAEVRTEPARSGDQNAAVVWRRLDLRDRT